MTDFANGLNPRDNEPQEFFIYYTDHYSSGFGVTVTTEGEGVTTTSPAGMIEMAFPKVFFKTVGLSMM